jgi:hypothetical protein
MAESLNMSSAPFIFKYAAQNCGESVSARGTHTEQWEAQARKLIQLAQGGLVPHVRQVIVSAAFEGLHLGGMRIRRTLTVKRNNEMSRRNVGPVLRKSSQLLL